LLVMNSALQTSWRTASGTSFLWFRRWFFKMLLCNGYFNDKDLSNIEVPIFAEVNDGWLGFLVSSTWIQMITRFSDTRYLYDYCCPDLISYIIPKIIARHARHQILITKYSM
jgi:hypothetical protein